MRGERLRGGIGRRACLLAAVGLCGLLAGCSGYTTGASKVTATAAALNYVGSCDAGEHCSWYVRYRRLGTSSWTQVPAMPKGPVAGPVTNAALTETVSGLSLNTAYEYQACGNSKPGDQFACAGPDGTGNTTDKFTTQTLPTTVACGQTITANTTLANDLTCPNGLGLVIGASNITVDLNGHTIGGGGGGAIDYCTFDQSGEEKGILNQVGSGVTIRNGTIRRFDDGIHVNSNTNTRLSDNLIRDVTVQDMTCTAIYLDSTQNSRVEHNTIAYDDQALLRATHNIWVRGSDRASVEDNRVFDSSHAQITLDSATFSRVKNNTIGGTFGADDFGIELLGSHDNAVVGNMVDGARLDGIVMVFSTSHDNIIDRNTVSGVSNDPDPSDPGQFAGIEAVQGASHNRITNNTLLNNQAPGIAIGLPLSGSPGPSDGNTVTGNNSHDNSGGAASDGIIVGSLGTNTLIASNTANHNGHDGIHTSLASTTISANTANSNTNLGIEGVPGVTDGGGNHASGNGNAFAQCTYINCSP